MLVYKKGQGWIEDPGFITKTKDGKQVRLEMRKPNPGEVWDHGNNIKSFEEWENIVRNIRYDSFQTYDAPEDYGENGYCVITLVEG